MLPSMSTSACAGETKTVRVNIRVIATTNLTLLRMVEEGSFRADLYYRLNVVPLSLPPLRQRREDIRGPNPDARHERFPHPNA